MEVRNTRIKFETAAVVCCESCFSVNECTKSRAGSGRGQLVLYIVFGPGCCVQNRGSIDWNFWTGSLCILSGS